MDAPVVPAPVTPVVEEVPVEPEAPRALAQAIGAGARRIRLLPGIHRPETPVQVHRSVTIVGEPSGGGARLYASVAVTASGVRMRDLRIRGSVDARFAQDLQVSSATIGASGTRDAVSLYASSARLENVVVEGGGSSGLFAAGSTVTLQRVRILANQSEHALRSDGGRVEGTGVELLGGRASVMWAGGRARVGLRNGRLESPTAQALGLHATGGARVRLDGIEGRTDGSTVLARSSEVVWTGGLLEASGSDPVLGVRGATVALSRVEIEAGPGGLLNLAAHRGRTGSVTLKAGRIRTSGAAGAVVASGRLELTEVEWSGPEGRLGSASDAAVLLRGPRSSARLERSQFRDLPGWLAWTTDRARLEIRQTSATRVGGGFRFEGVRPDPAGLDAVILRSCTARPGIAAVDSLVHVRSSTIADCRPGGIVSGVGGLVVVQRSRIRGGGFGIGAFAGGAVEVQGGSIEDTAMAVVVGCSGDPRVELQGTHTSTLPRIQCR